jgi:hypothetical protein
MNPFTKQWITATVAPESIMNIRAVTNEAYLDVIQNETKSKRVFVLSDNDKVLAIGQNYEDIRKPNFMSFIDALQEVAKILELPCYSV